MVQAILRETCYLGMSKVVTDVARGGVAEYDLVEYGCDGDRQVELRRRHIEIDPRQGAVPAAELAKTIRFANTYLAHSPHCDCIRNAASGYVSARHRSVDSERSDA